MKRIFLILALLIALLLISCNKAPNNLDNGYDTSVPTNTNTETSTVQGGVQGQNGTVQNDWDDQGTSNSQPKSNDQNSTQGEEKMNNFVLKGIVKGRGTHLEIEVIESDYAFGIYWVIVPNSISILDASGSEISLDSIKNGDIVNITYNGQTMLSYPPQIVALAISIEK